MTNELIITKNFRKLNQRKIFKFSIYHFYYLIFKFEFLDIKIYK